MSIVLHLILAASTLNPIFDEGVELYNDQLYPEAVLKFEDLVFRGVETPELFYNLGNAYYRSGYLAPAIANYERALQLKPTMVEAHQNLTQCINQTEKGFLRPQPPAWEQALLFWHFNLTLGRVKYLALTFWFAAWTILLVRQFRKYPYLRRTAACCLALAAMFALSWQVKTRPMSLAVGSADKIPVHYGNKVTDTVRFELYEGDRVQIEDERDGWIRVRTPDNERGWIQDPYVIRVGPPYQSPTIKPERYESKEATLTPGH